MDLATLLPDADETAIMVVRSPVTGDELISDKDGLPVTITLASVDSERFTKAKHAAINRRLRDTSGKPQTAENLETEGLKGLAAITVALSPNLEYNGRPVQCTTEELVSLYRRLPWLKDQVNAFVSARENFMKPAPQG